MAGWGWGYGTKYLSRRSRALPVPVEEWLPTVGFFSNDAGTVAQTTNGGNVNCWLGRNGTRLLQRHPSFIPTLVSNALGAGRHAIRLDSRLTASDNLPSSLNRRDHTIVVAYARRLTTTAPIVNLYSTAGDFGSAALHVQNGYQRPETGSFGSGVSSELGVPLSAFGVLGFSSGATSYRYCINDRLAMASDAPMAAGAFAAFGLGTISGVLSGGDCGYVSVYNRALTATELQAVCVAAMSTCGITRPSQAANVIFSGNSITYGANAAFNPYSSVSAAAAGVSAHDYQVWGQSGITTDSLAARDATLAPTLFKAGVKNVVVCWELTNSLGANVTASATLASHAALVATWRGAGFIVVAPTVLNRTSLFSGGQTSGGFASSQATVNSEMVANPGGIYGDVICDLSSVASVGTAGDGTHPVQAGHDSIGSLIGLKIVDALAL
jgi:hypothetical protein